MCALGSKGVTVVSRTTWQQILYKMHKPQKLKAKPLIFEKTACILADGMVKYKTVVSERRGNPVDTEA